MNMVKQIKKIRMTFNKLIQTCEKNIGNLTKKCTSFLDLFEVDKQRTINLILIMEGICTFQYIIKFINEKLNEIHFDDNSFDTQEKMCLELQIFVKKFKSMVTKNINDIFKSYDMDTIRYSDEKSNAQTIKRAPTELLVERIATLPKKASELKKREMNLIEFCKWTEQFIDSLLRSKIYEIKQFEDLKIWLQLAWDTFINTIKSSCEDNLSLCSEYLLNRGPEKWKAVDETLKICKSLRKVNRIEYETNFLYCTVMKDYNYAGVAIDIKKNNFESFGINHCNSRI